MKATVSRSSFGTIRVEKQKRPIGNMAEVIFGCNLRAESMSQLRDLLRSHFPAETQIEIGMTSMKVCFQIDPRFEHRRSSEDQVTKLIEDMFHHIEQTPVEMPELAIKPASFNHGPEYFNDSRLFSRRR